MDSVSSSSTAQFEQLAIKAKHNCRYCLGRGFVVRSWPTGNKESATINDPCDCIKLKKKYNHFCIVSKWNKDTNKWIETKIASKPFGELTYDIKQRYGLN